jgi:hypothetical protein
MFRTISVDKEGSRKDIFTPIKISVSTSKSSDNHPTPETERTLLGVVHRALLSNIELSRVFIVIKWLVSLSLMWVEYESLLT